MSENQILISYFPMIEGDPGRQYTPDDSELEEIVKKASEAAPNVDGVAWAYYPFDKQETIIPVFLVKNSKAIADHLVYWAENDVGKRFDLFIDEREEGYAIVLVPNVEESIKRYKLARLAIYEDIPQDVHFQVLFGLLGTVVKGGTYKSIKDRVLSNTYIGFVDPDDLEKDYDSITIVGPVNLKKADEDSIAKQFCDQRFEEMLDE